MLTGPTGVVLSGPGGFAALDRRIFFERIVDWIEELVPVVNKKPVECVRDLLRGSKKQEQRELNTNW